VFRMQEEEKARMAKDEQHEENSNPTAVAVLN